MSEKEIERTRQRVSRGKMTGKGRKKEGKEIINEKKGEERNNERKK